MEEWVVFCCTLHAPGTESELLETLLRKASSVSRRKASSVSLVRFLLLSDFSHHSGLLLYHVRNVSWEKEDETKQHCNVLQRNEVNRYIKFLESSK